MYTKIAYINYLTSSSNIFIGKTPVPNFNIPFAHPSISKKPYYNSSLSLNKSINPTGINL